MEIIVHDCAKIKECLGSRFSKQLKRKFRSTRIRQISNIIKKRVRHQPEKRVHSN